MTRAGGPVFPEAGLGHAFTALSEEATVLYLCSTPYSPGRKHGVHPPDPDLGIAWPADTEPVLSPRSIPVTSHRVMTPARIPPRQVPPRPASAVPTRPGWPHTSAPFPPGPGGTGRAARTPSPAARRRPGNSAGRAPCVDPVEDLMRQNPALHINLSSSPFWHSKRAIRREMLAAIARRDGIPVLMCNQVGGNDSLIFDGSSFALNGRGELIAQAASFVEDLVLVDPFHAAPVSVPENDDTEAAYRALVLGTRDYVRKCGFRKAIVGLSGGIDSALVAAIAAEALGAENVIGVGMPSPYSSAGSIDDSQRLAANLGIRFETISIRALFAEFNQALAPLFHGMKEDITEENIQPRIRGTLLMALSNKFGALVLTTGNKSEMAVGYCTLYGDMVGALAVIGDLVKTRVYAVCHWLNQDQEKIPAAILTKPPTAELRPGQMDTDSLPPYEVLDPIVEAYVERYETPERIAAEHGFPLDLVLQTVSLIERSQYKRQQAAPVLKVTAKSFGMGRRFPIAVKVQV